MFGIAWAMTSGSLLLLNVMAPNASAQVELIVLTVANLLATLVRFALLRLWVFRAQMRRGGQERRLRSRGRLRPADRMRTSPTSRITAGSPPTFPHHPISTTAVADGLRQEANPS